jgi:hypothetical protein
MTVVAVIFAPLVIAYQAWRCHTFRARIRGPAAEVPPGPSSVRAKTESPDGGA